MDKLRKAFLYVLSWFEREAFPKKQQKHDSLIFWCENKIVNSMKSQNAPSSFYDGRNLM